MLSFNLHGIKLELSFSFFAVIAFAACCDAKGVCVSLVCRALHESGHLAAMLHFGKTPEALCFYGGGIKIKSAFTGLNVTQEALVLSAGCSVNAFLAAACFAAGRGDSSFAAANVMLCLFNLLPFEKLDGGRLASLITDKCPSLYKLFQALRITAGAVLCAVAVRSISSGAASITLIAALVYIGVADALS